MIANVLSTAIAIWMVVAVPSTVLATEWYVAPGHTGRGTKLSPFGAVQEALRAAQPGDTVTLRPGIYHEAIRTVRDGSAAAPIRLRAESGMGPVVLTNRETVLQINHSFVVVEGLVLDGAYSARIVVNVKSGVQSVVLRKMEVRRSGRDCVNIGAAVDVLIEDSLIHHCLNSTNGRTDAHGIAAGAVRGLIVRGTEIHTFSGDAIQMNRTGTAHAPGWDDVRIERCRLWLAPLAQAENGFPAGSVPGENAVDTKTAPSSPRARIMIRDTEAWGFGGAIRQQAAFNLKERIDATLDGVTVWTSDIAFRLRGSGTGPDGAWVRIQNAVLHDVSVGVRYEDDIQRLRVWNTTFGLEVARAFEEVLSPRGRPDVRNLLLLGSELPREAVGASNLSVDRKSFVDAESHDYRLTVTSPAIGGGTTLQDVTTDRTGRSRPQASAYDIGAHEF